MSLPINPTTIFGAVQAAREVAGSLAGSIADATGFDEVLRGAGPIRSAAELTNQAVQAIEEKLRSLGIDANPPLEFAVQSGGKLRVTGDHPRAAEIESVLAADDQLSGLVNELHRASGPVRLTAGVPSSR